MIRRYCLMLGFLVASVVLPVHAQVGCADSPESPTIVLALVGGVGAVSSVFRSSRSGRK